MPKFVNHIDPSKTAIIVVDMQNAFLDKNSPAYVQNSEQLLPIFQDFLSKCRTHNIKVIYAKTTYKQNKCDMSANNKAVFSEMNNDFLVENNPNTQICKEIAPQIGDIQISKQYYSAFYGTNLDIILRANNINLVAIAGLCTDTGCHATARDAFYLNYDVAVLSDLTITRQWPDCGYGTVSSEESQLATLNNLFSTNSDIFTSSAMLDMI